MAGMPTALSWVCTAAVLATSSLHTATVHSTVHFLQLHQKYRSSQNQPSAPATSHLRGNQRLKAVLAIPKI